MRFEIKSPWTQWLVRTIIKDFIHYAKVDGGSPITLIGIDIAVRLGLKKDTIVSCPHIEYYAIKPWGFAPHPIRFLKKAEQKL